MSKLEILQELLMKDYDFVYVTQQGDEIDVSVNGDDVWTFGADVPVEIIIDTIKQNEGRLEAANDNR